MDKFYRIHLIRSALQVKGAPMPEIELITAGIEQMGGLKYVEWNKLLDAQGIKLLTSILGENGVPYANLVIDGFLSQMKSHFNISDEEIRKNLKARLEGLN
jgi:hypothetical protein